MNPTASQQVTLKVHLLGTIAYVPDPDGRRLWALFPNGQSSEPAPWSSTTDTEHLKARAPHFPLLVADRDAIDDENTTETIFATLKPFDASKIEPESLYPLTESCKVISAILDKGLDFGLEGHGVRIKKKVNKFVPKLRKISPLHSSVDDRYRPESEDFDSDALSTAFCLNAGVLSAGGFFQGEGNGKVDFGRVTVNASGELEIGSDIVWKKRIANHLIWKTKLPAGQRSFTLSTVKWKDNPPGQYTFKAIDDSHKIEIAIMNAEVDAAALFLSDAILQDGVNGFPDPDFDLFYKLSVNRNHLGGRRFPTPKSGSAGKSGKPCSGGMFVGFA